ncbi:MAG: carboxymuconolactone decarboxylase family protein [Actinomycetota bacterium]
MTSSGPDRPPPRLDGVAEVDDEVAELLANALTHDGEPLNIFGVLAHHPKLLKRFNLMGGFLLNRGLVPAREREIVILRVGWNARAEYEFGQHTVIGREAGLSDTEIAAIAGRAHEWSDDDRALLALADDLCARDCASDTTWAALRPRWSDAELVELVICAGFYRLVSGFLNTFGVPLDDGVPGWPT